MKSAPTVPESAPRATPLSASSEEVARAFRRPPADFIDVGHSRLAYRRFGSGPDLVLIHGWPLSSATFRSMIPSLATRYTCHLIDLPGAGHTEWGPDTPIDLESHTQTVLSAIDTMGLDRFALLAHDSGAVVARLVAAEAGDRVTALVLGNTEIPGHRPWLVELYSFSVKLPFGSAVLRWLMKFRTVRHSFLGFGGCFADPSYADGEFHDLFVAPLLESDRVNQGQMQLLQHIDWKVVDRLEDVHHRIRAPSCLIWGSDDPFFPVARAKRMLSALPHGSELVEVSGAKLFVHEERAVEFADKAMAFLAATVDDSVDGEAVHSAGAEALG